MILAERNGADRELRMPTVEFGTSAVPRPSDSVSWASWAGALTTPDQVFGIPAASAAIRLISEAIASLPLVIFRGTGAQKEWAGDSWQYQLLECRPSEEFTAYDFLADVSMGLEGYGNAYLQKLKDRRGRVGELIPLSPDNVSPERDKVTKEKVFRVYQDAKTVTLTASDILHVRGWTTKSGALKGLSPVQLHRHALGSALALGEFSGRFFRNSATPAMAISVPGTMNKRQADEFIDIWSDRHAGTMNAHKPALLTQGAKIEVLGMSLRDAQYVDGMRFSVEEIARIFRVPPDLLGAAVLRGSAMTTEQESMRFLRFSLFPRLKRIEYALRLDTDLFPPSRPEYPQFLVEDMLRADTATQANADKSDVQTGIMLVDEIRARRGLPPLPGGAGQIPQITPVGGAPNDPFIPSPATPAPQGAEAISQE